MQNDTPLVGCEIIHFSAHDAPHLPLGACERKTFGRAALDSIFKFRKLWHRPWGMSQHSYENAITGKSF